MSRRLPLTVCHSLSSQHMIHPFRKTMAKRSSPRNPESRALKLQLRSTNRRRHRQQAAAAPIEGTAAREERLRATQEANLQHLIAIIRNAQEDELGQFFGAALTTVRRLSLENIEAIRILLENAVRRIQEDPVNE